LATGKLPATRIGTSNQGDRMKVGRGLAVLVVLEALAGCGGSDGEEPAEEGADEAQRAEQVVQQATMVIGQLDGEEISSRVEELRDLEFDETPTIGTVTAEQSAQRAQDELGELGPERQRANDAFIARAKLQGVVPPDFELDAAAATVGGEALQGFFDPESDELNLVAGPMAAERESIEPIAAHELLHALQDQTFDVDLEGQPVDDPDASAAYLSLIEGDATVLQGRYAEEYGLPIAAEVDPEAEAELEKLPYALQYSLAAPYELGALFVAALVEEDDSYGMVNDALRSPPETMAEIVDLERYLSGEEPAQVRLAVDEAAPDGFEQVDSSTWGLNDAVELLVQDEEGLPPIIQAAAEWDGGRVELWRQGEEPCEGACTDRSLAVVGSTWSSAEAAEAYGAVVTESLQARRAQPAGEGVFTVDGGGVALAADGRDLTMAWAPTPEQASELAERAQR
jgi:hypothetical protein